MLTRRTVIHTEQNHNMERWLLTYADMITLLAAFFLMLFSLSSMSGGKFSDVAAAVRGSFSGARSGGDGILDGGQTRGERGYSNAEYGAAAIAVGDLRRFVEQQKLSAKVTTRQDERGLVISLVSDSLLFERGGAELRGEGRTVLRQVADVLKSVRNAVQIEGHTCDLPIQTERFPSNWELSTARAGAVLRFYTDGLGLPAKRFVAAGYADTRPLAPNRDEPSRARNRRVDIILLKTDAEREADLRRKDEAERVLEGSTGDDSPELAPAGREAGTGR